MTWPAGELLRRHIEAVWALALPPLEGKHVMLAEERAQPPWSLYLAELYENDHPSGRAYLWRHDVPEAERASLMARAEAALRLPATEAADGVEREVALIQMAPPALSLAAAAHLARRLTVADQPLLEAFWPGEGDAVRNPAGAPMFGVVVDGRLLSLAHSSRRTPTTCELGVETLPEARRHGYALAVTVRWAAAVAAEGLIPFYSAHASNTASLALARAAGYRPFAAGASIVLAS